MNKQLYENRLRSPKALANVINNNLFGGDFNELNYYGENQDEENFKIYCRAINGYWRKTSRPGICFSKDEIDFMYNNWNDIMSDALCENKQTKNTNKQQLYESIMKNVAIQVKKALNEALDDFVDEYGTLYNNWDETRDNPSNDELKMIIMDIFEETLKLYNRVNMFKHPDEFMKSERSENIIYKALDYLEHSVWNISYNKVKYALSKYVHDWYAKD